MVQRSVVGEFPVAEVSHGKALEASSLWAQGRVQEAHGDGARKLSNLQA